MRLPALLALAVLVPSYAFGQSKDTPNSTTSDNSSVEKELRALQIAFAQQQKQIRRQQQEIDSLRGQLSAGMKDGDASPSAPRVIDAVLHLPDREAVSGSAAAAVPSVPIGQESAAKEKESPLSFSIGNVQFTPGGSIDFTSVFRTTDIGSGVGTTFGSVPFNNTGAGQLTEDRLTAQNSRVTLKLQSKFGETTLRGILKRTFSAMMPQTCSLRTMRIRTGCGCTGWI